MTSYAPLSVTTVGMSGGVLTLRAAGRLDHDSSGHFTHHVTRALGEHPATRTLRLDCGGLDAVDAMGLSALLSLRRRLDGLGTTLRLTGRSARLDGLLTVTGTFGHLIGEAGPAAGEQEPGAVDSDPSRREDTSR
ncbi:STAS domain-containing protein [Streptomyces sp. BH055]|uniref:STAS domain-containing protein n=1 Tax=Streptomyces sp. BH055 TaxID=3401173 RepID=UPI003BB60357